MNKFTWTLGDTSKDGHGVTEVVWIESNKTPQEIREIYQRVKENSGFDFLNKVCADYEEKNNP